MTSSKLRLLGPFEFEQNGVTVPVQTIKAQALLAYLALQSKAQPREQIVTLLWPDSTSRAARKNLTNVVWSIRKVFGDEILRSEGDWLSLSSVVWVDVLEVEAAGRADEQTLKQLETASSHYRGDLLQNLSLADSPEFELWLTTERERWRQITLQLLQRQILHYRQRQAWAKIIKTAKLALTLDPLQEKMHCTLMEGFVHTGDRNRALRQYDLLQTQLKQELDVEPSPTTTALHEAILKGDYQQPVRATQPKIQTTSPFVGRLAELDHLDQALRQTNQGQTRIVMLTGELGIGKTHLWQVWRDRQSLIQQVWDTRCLPTSQPIPYAPLTRIIDQPQVFDQLTTLAPVWLTELALLLPEIRVRWPHLPRPVTNPPEEAQYRLLAALTHLFQMIQPSVLFIDDLHWVDTATVDWLLYFIDRLKYPLLLVGTYRPEESTSHLEKAVVQWEREDILTRLSIPHFTQDEVAELGSMLTDSKAPVGQLYHRTAGNPYFVTQLSLLPNEDLPLALTSLVETRLSTLTVLQRQVLQIVAILEPNATVALLCTILEHSEDEIVATVEGLQQLNWLNEQQNGYEFVHPLLAEVIAQTISQTRWRLWHRKTAQALEDRYATRLPEIAGQLVRHYQEGQSAALAAQYADIAAERAKALHAPIEAIKFYRQAFTLAATPTRQMRLGQMLTILPEHQLEAREHLQAALRAFEAQENYRLLLECCTSLIETYIPSEVGEAMLQWIIRATTYQDRVDEPVIKARLCQLTGLSMLWGHHQLVEARIQLKQAIDIATVHHLDEIAGKSYFDLGISYLQSDDLNDADRAFREALKCSIKNSDVVLEAVCCNNLTHVALLQGHLSNAHFWLEKGVATMRRYDLILPRQYLYSSQGEIALSENKLDQAKTWFQQAIDEAQRFNNWRHIVHVKANLGLVAKADGQIDQAHQLLYEAHSLAEEMPHLKQRIAGWLRESYPR